MATQGIGLQRGRGGRMSRSDEAVEAIESMIVSNDWAAGHKLPSQRTLAEQLEFSRPTIREALVAMETMGRIEIKPGNGVFLVDKDSPAPLRESWSDRLALAGRESQMYQFRNAIEPAVAELVALNATSAQMEDMNVIVKAMQEARDNGDRTEFARLDFTFHSQMIEAANNRFFTEALSPFLGLFFESQKLPFVVDDGVDDTVCEHEAIMECIRKRNPVAARKAMELHVQAVAQRAGVKLVG